jgi:hypothetical protein
LIEAVLVFEKELDSLDPPERLKENTNSSRVSKPSFNEGGHEVGPYHPIDPLQRLEARSQPEDSPQVPDDLRAPSEGARQGTASR